MRHRQSWKSRQSLLRLLGTSLALFLLIYLLSRQGWGEIFASIQQISVGRFIIAFGLIMMSRFAVSARWYALLRSARAQMPFQQITRITFAGLFASNFLPTTIGGDVVRLAGALQVHTDRAMAAASIMIDRLVGLLGMATALPFGATTLGAWFARGGPQSSTSQLIGLALLLPQSWGRRLWQFGNQATRRLGNALTLWSQRPQSLFLALAFTWTHMLCKFLAIQVLFAGMGEDISFWLVAGLWSFTYFITLFPLSINGLGLQEVSMAFIYANLGEISLNNALTAALLIRTLEMVASLPGVLYLPAILAGMEAEPQPEAGHQDSVYQ